MLKGTQFEFLREMKFINGANKCRKQSKKWTWEVEFKD